MDGRKASRVNEYTKSADEEDCRETKLHCLIEVCEKALLILGRMFSEDQLRKTPLLYSQWEGSCCGNSRGDEGKAD